MSIIAVDFDGTIQLAGKRPNLPLIERLRVSQRRGDRIILWTCREGDRLRDAISFCLSNGLRPDLVNENAPETIRRLGYNPRKILADCYIDDKNV